MKGEISSIMLAPGGLPLLKRDLLAISPKLGRKFSAARPSYTIFDCEAREWPLQGESSKSEMRRGRKTKEVYCT